MSTLLLRALDSGVLFSAIGLNSELHFSKKILFKKTFILLRVFHCSSLKFSYTGTKPESALRLYFEKKLLRKPTPMLVLQSEKFVFENL